MAGCVSQDRLDSAIHREISRAESVQPAVGSNTVADAAQHAIAPAEASAEEIDLGLNTALQLAAQHSRTLQDNRDRIYAEGLALFGTRREFEVSLDGTVGYVFNKGVDGSDDRTAATLEAARILPTGARLNLSGAASRATQRPDGAAAESGYDSTARARLEQPLLAGAGYEASHESLTQAERGFIYALREFALQRQDAALQTVQGYYGLQRQRTILGNTRKNVDQVVYLRQRSEALFKVRRAPAIDVLRSQQEELSALNRLNSTEESFAIETGRFFVQLGLPPSWRARLHDEIPELRPVDWTQERALALATTLRPDVATARERLEDAERQVRLARRGLLPEVKAFGEATLQGRDQPSLTGAHLEDTYSAGVEMALPLDQRDERDALKRAELGRQAAERQWQQKRDDVALEIAASLSQLRAQATTVKIQEKNRDIAERRAQNASLRFKNGELSNRDVVEAETELLQARNAYVEALLDYEIQRLRLLRNIGLLDVAADGTLIERPPPPA